MKEQKKVTFDDIRAQSPGKPKTYVLCSECACQNARASAYRCAQTGGFTVKTSIDVKKRIITITKKQK